MLDLLQITTKNKIVAIIFYNIKSAFSKNISLEIRDICEKNNICTCLLDTCSYIEIAIQYFISIEGLPTVLFFIDGKYIPDVRIENANISNVTKELSIMKHKYK